MTTGNEAERLNALRQLNLLDTPPSESFDRITRAASQLFTLPIAAVSLTNSDRQWFKSRVGLERPSIPRDLAPCAEVAMSAATLVIPDLLTHALYRNSILAQNGIRFYAGAPLITAQGFSLGSMCVLGPDAREVSDSEMLVLGDLAAMVMAQIELQHAFGRIDSVSGLPNRAQFIEDMQDLARDQTVPEQRHLVLVDIANAAQVNEAVRVMGPGHFDALLLEAANKLVAGLASGCKAYHVAATQMVFLAGAGMPEADLVTRLEAGIGALRSSASSRFFTTATIGVAPFVPGISAPLDVLRMAHSAGEDARRLETKVSLYSTALDEGHRRRFTLINQFSHALDASDALRLVYQPRMDIASGRCLGAEALLRWRHPTLGNVPPGEFIPLIELTTMARDTTAWVIEAALRQIGEWRDIGLDLRISVNISAANLDELDFLDRLRAALARHAVPAESLELEVTESAMMNDSGRALAMLADIAALGVKLAIDDFGTGYSSLSYLQRLPAHVVKIDQSFMHGLVDDGRKQALVETMVILLHKFGFGVVAEGVETEDVLALLSQVGCDEAQGYLFAKPMPPAEFVAWLAARSATHKLVAA